MSKRQTPLKQPVGFISHKELADAFGVHKETLKKELKMIRALRPRRFRRYYTPRELKIIFAHMGNPYEK